MPYRRFPAHAAVGTVAWAAVYATLGAAASTVAAGPLLVARPSLLVGALLVRRATRIARTPPSRTIPDGTGTVDGDAAPASRSPVSTGH